MPTDQGKQLLSKEAAREALRRHAPDQLAAFETALAEGRKIESMQILRKALPNGLDRP